VNWSSRIDYDVMLAKKPWAFSEYMSYSHSKTANLLFTHELANRLSAAGSDTLALACHPGLAMTNLHSEFNKKWGSGIVGFFRPLVSHDDVGGALSIVMAAVDQTVTASYYGPDGLLETRGAPKVGAQWRPFAKDSESAKKLWVTSEKLVDFKAVI
jgi:NAD(P)-dependent dehydrogenase (short-subunit alcohol dehydrogenase family)